MAQVIVIGIKTSEIAEGFTELFLKVETDQGSSYDWFDAAEIAGNEFQAYANSKLSEYLSAIAILEAEWDAVDGNFPSTDTDGNPTVIFIAKAAYVREKKKIAEMQERENNIKNKKREIAIDVLYPDANKQALINLYINGIIRLDEIIAQNITLQSTTLDTIPKLSGAVKQIGNAMSDLSLGLKKLLKGMKTFIQ